jgi:hypothetical protein
MLTIGGALDILYARVAANGACRNHKHHNPMSLNNIVAREAVIDRCLLSHTRCAGGSPAARPM